MPVVSVPRDALFARLGRSYDQEEFELLCFEFGIELDDVTTEAKRAKDQGQEASAASEEVIYRIDIPANRYDLLCLEGIAKALNVFLGRERTPDFRLVEPAGGPSQRHVMTIEPETMLIRPFIVCAVLRGVTFNEERYNSFIELQDKLHQNICRKRSLVAIGTHDLGTIQGPFTYEALPPEDITFVPLKQTRTFNARELMDFYKKDPSGQQLKAYVPIIEGSPVFPVVFDANRTVLSLPPIINGAHSAISLQTRDVFIECTATDLTKANIVLDTVVAMFSEHCDVPFTVEPVNVIDASGVASTCPAMSSRDVDVDVRYINSRTGVDLDAHRTSELLTRMMLSATPSDDGERVRVAVPPTRSDVLHPCDVMEDVAIAYGYNNLSRTVPKVSVQARQFPLNHGSDLIRQECAMAGFTEVLTWILCSEADNFDRVRRVDDGRTGAIIANPCVEDTQMARTSLLPGLLKTLSNNKDAPLPVKLFEVGDVVLIDDTRDVGARNERRMIGLYCNTSAGFEVVHGLLDQLMIALGVGIGAEGYSVEGCEEESGPYFPGRLGKVMFKGQDVGRLGVLHPEVLANFEIVNPVSVIEINVEPLLVV